MKNLFRDKIILVTGGTGSIGSEIVKQLLKYNPRAIRILSRDDTKQFYLRQNLGSLRNVRFLIGDVRDKTRIDRAMENVNIVFHCAALKHVMACEYNPFEAVKTNVLGTQNLIDSAIAHDVEKFVMISTDKAAEPVNAMGITKLLAEKLVAASQYAKSNKTNLSCVRFGNVMGSRGSVIELWKHQILNEGTLTITNPEMTRFMMTIPQAVSLVLDTVGHMRGGEIFILKMPVIKLQDLAEVMIEELCKKYGKDPRSIKIKKIGIKPGEKVDEVLMTDDEAKMAYDLKDKFMILSHINALTEKFDRTFYPNLKNLNNLGGYSVKDIKPLNKEQIKKLICSANLI